MRHNIIAIFTVTLLICSLFLAACGSNPYKEVSNDKQGVNNDKIQEEPITDEATENKEINLGDTIVYDGDEITLKASYFYNKGMTLDGIEYDDMYYVQFKITNKKNVSINFYMDKVYLDDESVDLAYSDCTNPIKILSGKTETCSYAYSKSGPGGGYHKPDSLEALYGLNGSFSTQLYTEDDLGLVFGTDQINTFDLRTLKS